MTSRPSALSDTTRPSFFRLGVAVLAAALLVRAIVCFVIVPAWERRTNTSPAPDAYPVLARNLVDGGILGFAPDGASPTTTRGPGFPAWLAPAAAVLGEAPHALAFWGSLPGAGAAVWLAFEIARRRGRTTGVVAGLVLAMHPLPAWMAGRCMSDEFYGALGFGAAAALCRGVGDAKACRRAWTISGVVLLSAQMLTRSTGILTAAAVGGAVVIAAGRRRWLPAFVAIGLALIPPLAWSVRTSRLEGHAVFVQSLTGYNFWLGEAFDRLGPESARGEHARARTEFVFAAAGEPAPPPKFWWGELTPGDLSRMEPRLLAAARQRIAGDPAGYAGRFARGLWQFWVRAETGSRTLQYVAVVLPLLVLAALGAWRQLRGRDDTLGIALVLVIVLHTLAYAAVVPLARYSVGVYPAAVFLAASAFRPRQPWRLPRSRPGAPNPSGTYH